MAPPIESGNSSFFRKKSLKIIVCNSLIQAITLLIALFMSLEHFPIVWLPCITEQTFSAIFTFVVLLFLFNALQAVVYLYCAGNNGDSQSYGRKSDLLLRPNHPKMKGLLWICLGVFSTTLFYHLFFVMYGASLIDNISETYHLSVILTATTVIPGCFILGGNPEDWLKVFIHQKPSNIVEQQVLATAFCSLIGTWIGGAAIPLDWDRPWQVWPISCVLGALFGYVTGLFSSTFYALYLHRKYSKSKFI